MKLHLFYPENDLALASGQSNYTAPAKVLPLRRAGAMLPLWYGEPGDSVCGAVNAAWLDDVTRRFDLAVKPFDHVFLPDMQPAPWGWSAASAAMLVQQGVPPSALPDASALSRIRQLSHRRTAALVQGLIAARLPFAIAPAAVECSSVDALPILLGAGRSFIAKLPWSSSGRGLLDSRKCSVEHFVRQAEGMIHSQGSFMLEQAYERVVDFAMLFDAGITGCSFSGYSLFDATDTGRYTGNLLASDEQIEQRLSRYVSVEQLHAVRAALCDALEQVCRGIYAGPVGVDMLIARQAEGYLLDATVEINFRMTMGRVARNFADRFLAPDVTGSFKVLATVAPADTSEVVDGRLVSGTLLLTPPDRYFNFVVEVQ